jgi:hypothetical protein
MKPVRCKQEKRHKKCHLLVDFIRQLRKEFDGIVVKPTLKAFLLTFQRRFKEAALRIAPAYGKNQSLSIP